MTAPTPLPKLVLYEFGKTNVPDLESYFPFCLKAHRSMKVPGPPL